MSPSLPTRFGTKMLIVLATLFAGTIFAASASALSPIPPKSEGKAAFALNAGKAGKTLKRSGVKVKPIGPAQVKKVNRAILPVRNASISQSRSEISLNGGFVLRKGKRSMRVDMLNVSSRAKRTIIGGRVRPSFGKKTGGVMMTNIFKVGGKPSISKKGKTDILRFNGARLSFTNGVAKSLRQKLRLKKAPRGTLGKFNLNARLTEYPPPTWCDADPTAPGCTPDPCETDPNAEGCPIVDPYLAQCGVDATSKVVGTLPEAAALPTLASPKGLAAGNNVSWGFKASFRNYITFPAGGSLKAVAPATVQAGMGPVASGFNFPVEGGEYAANDAIDMSDDQAIVPGTGTSLFCATGHGFRVAISNPTVVIDGDNSRIVADVDTNLTGVWTPTQRIDLAELDLSGATPFYNQNGSEVTWGEIPATLTQSGGEAICGTGEQLACDYTAGTELDPIDVTVKTPYDTSDFDALAEYVATKLPFPLPDASLGGCTLPGTAGGSATAARTVDEHLSYNGTQSAWTASGTSSSSLPTLSGGEAVTGGAFQWGVRRGLRSSVNTTGQFNLSGTTASHTPYFGSGPGSTPRIAPAPGQMGGTYPEAIQKFFSWPAAASGGTFQANGAGSADDKLVLKATGRVGICQTGTGQGYGTILSDPTIVIDGTNSRISADVASRYRLSWVRGRVDLASIDMTDPAIVSEVTSVDGVSTAEWTFPRADETVPSAQVGPIKLTEAGKSVFNIMSPATYVEGAVLDAAIISASFPTPAE